ncbi:NAD(P)H-dependent oxidoreductase subunit E [soil metagenome]
MSYYEKHLFFCTNQRSGGRQCCQDAGAEELRHYAKKRIKALGLNGKGKVRVNSAGCLDRCAEGPVLVIYPEGVWYAYKSKEDVDEILEQHVMHGQIVERLHLPGK